MGFDRIELGHGIRLSLMDGILKMYEAGKVQFSSLHNFCPLPIEITRASPDCYKFSSPDARERERALKHSYQTIDFAARLGARFVVLHLGRTPLGDYTENLVRMCEAGLGASRGYVKEKLECIRKREEQAPPYFQRAREGLGALISNLVVCRCHTRPRVRRCVRVRSPTSPSHQCGPRRAGGHSAGDSEAPRPVWYGA